MSFSKGVHIYFWIQNCKKDKKDYREINRVLNDMINRCCTVYALAIKDVSKTDIITNVDAYIDGMTLVALIGMCRA